MDKKIELIILINLKRKGEIGFHAGASLGSTTIYMNQVKNFGTTSEQFRTANVLATIKFNHLYKYITPKSGYKSDK